MSDDILSPGDVRPISIVDEMKKSYLDYAMSVIVSRALPDARDGLKPVHRRILFSMRESGYTPDKPHRKSARVVGDVIGKYHPHGDQAVYDALVRLAQDFSMRLPLVDGQGNFGSVDGDPPAAMRYTEVRMAKPAMFLLEDIDENTVDFQENYDGSEQEPVVLPARYPNLLVNGVGGIAVGMATNIPPHNLGEVIDAALALLANPTLDNEALMEFVPGPDFPTAGKILGRGGIRSAYTTGRGSVVMRAHVEIETNKNREAIIVKEIPYQVNKASLVEKIAELVREKRVEGISDLRDESDRDGMRIVIEIKKDSMAEVVLNQLWRFTPMQSSFGCNLVALDRGRPCVMTLKDMLRAFLNFREEVIGKRTRFRLGKARDRAHILVGLGIAVANIDEVVRLIRAAPDPVTAREQLMARHWPATDMAPLVALVADPRHVMSEDGTIQLSAEQAKAILDLRLQRLTALGRDEIAEELMALAKDIEDFLDILRSRERVVAIIVAEMEHIKAAFATPRKSEILDNVGDDLDDEDLIQREEMVVTVSHLGYIKRVPLQTYRAQRRGGKGRAAMQTRDEDFVTRLFVASTHAPVLFFSSLGRCYKQKVWRLPLTAPQARGKALINMLPLEQGERITTIMPLPEDESTWGSLDLMFATKSGGVRRNKLSDFADVNRAGKIAMKLDDGDAIVDVQICSEHEDVMLTTKLGQSIRFEVPQVRVFVGRTSTGVRGITLAKGDEVIGLSILQHITATSEERAAYLRKAKALRREEGDENTSLADDEEQMSGEAVQLSQERFEQMAQAEQFLLTVSVNGYGKRSSAYEYRVTGRGGKGITAMTMSERNGHMIASFPILEKDQIMLVTDGGQLIRCPVDGIRLAGRTTQGVTIFNTSDDEKVVSVECISDAGEDEDSSDEGVDEATEVAVQNTSEMPQE